MATNFVSSTVSAGQDATAAQYNNLRKDVLQNGGDYTTSGGSANAYTLSIDAAIAAYAAGQVFKFNANFANTGSATLNVNTLGAKTIKKNHDVNLESGDIEVGQLVVVMYDGTDMQLLSPTAIELTSAAKASLGGGESSDASAYHTHRLLPGFQQINTGLGITLNCGQAAYDAATGNFFLAIKATSGTSFDIYRFDLGTYSKTWQKGSVTASSGSFDGAANGGLMVGATYVWLVGRASGGGDIRIVRFNKDLTGAQVMTISGTANTDLQVSVTGDDSTLYVKSATSSTRLAVYTISGTTATRGTDISLTTGGDDMCIYDGSKFYSFRKSSSLSTFSRYPFAGGAIEATISRHLAEADNLSIQDGTGMSLIGFNSYDTNRFIVFLIHLEEFGTTDRYFIDAVLVDKT